MYAMHIRAVRAPALLLGSTRAGQARNCPRDIVTPMSPLLHGHFFQRETRPLTVSMTQGDAQAPTTAETKPSAQCHVR